MALLTMPGGPPLDTDDLTREDEIQHTSTFSKLWRKWSFVWSFSITASFRVDGNHQERVATKQEEDLRNSTGENSVHVLPEPDIEMEDLTEDATRSVPHRQLSVVDIHMSDGEGEHLPSEHDTESLQDNPEQSDVEMEEAEPQTQNQEPWSCPLLNAYESRWLEIVERNSFGSLSFNEIPWPTLIPITTPSSLTLDQVKAFVELPRRDVDMHDVISQELLRWHPDKFNNRILRLVRSSDFQDVGDTAMEVSRILITLRQLMPVS